MIRILLALVFVAVNAVFAFGGMYYFTSSDVLNSSVLGETTKSGESFSIRFDEKLTQSNLYAPTNVKLDKVIGSVAIITWKFEMSEMSLEANVPPQYAALSGFRIYRDGYWYTDVDLNKRNFIDTSLFAGDSYGYEVAPLTFDNKIEGTKSETLLVSIPKDEIRQSVQFSKKEISRYLAEGDSISEGQRAVKGRGWVDQVADSIKAKNGSIELENQSITGVLSSDIVGRIEKETLDFSPDLVSISVGLNDLYGASSPLGNVSMFQYKDNLSKSIKASKPSENRLIFLTAITLYKGCCDTETNKLIAWNKAIRDVAFENGAVYVDVAAAMTKNGKYELIEDILHPYQKGHDVIAKEVIEVLKKYISI
jgi:acyl-CoA thioesterase I